MRHPKLVEWERHLKVMFDRVDAYLEARYGDRYPLHPSRAPDGATSNREHDGLFNVGASFSAGYGSKLGRGYVIEVDMVTLSHIDSEIREQIDQDAIAQIRQELKKEFPGRNIVVERDGNVFKICGDLSFS